MKQYKYLHIIIKEIINQFGDEVLYKPTFVNLLLDFGAFKEIPQTKPVMQYMLQEGIIPKIASMANPNKSILNKINSFLRNTNPQIDIDEVLSLSSEISKKSSVNEEFSKFALNSILYGLGLINDVPLPQIGTNLAKGNNQSSPSVRMEDINEDTQYIIINVSPVDATLTIDNNIYSLQNGTFAGEFPIGIHTFKIEAPQYKSQSGTIDLQSSNKEEINATLQLLNNAVDVTLLAEDGSTEVFIDGISYGYGKITTILTAGNYVIESKRDKFYTLTETVVVSGKKQTIKLGTLTQMCGSLKVNVTPVGCNVYLNGNDVGKTPLMVKNITVGEKHVRVVSPEGTEITTLVKIEENKSSVYNCDIPSVVFDDYSELKIGDWYYDDGTFSHVKVANKKAIGIVFSLRTSAIESKHGWNHGQIIKIADDRGFYHRDDSFEWCKNTIKITETIDNTKLIDAINKIKTSKDPTSLFRGYEISKLDILENNSDFPIFCSAQKVKNKDLPVGLTSGWYIPNLYQCLEMAINLHDVSLQQSYVTDTVSCKPKKDIQAEVYTIIGKYLDTWTSSSKDDQNAWNFSMCEFNNTIHSAIQDKKVSHHHILVASF